MIAKNGHLIYITNNTKSIQRQGYCCIQKSRASGAQSFTVW